jgi:sugar/nucleoside kinase (ribokinase family)
MFISLGGMGNVAATVSKLGGKSAFCGMVGDDILGSLYLQDLREMEFYLLFLQTLKIQLAYCYHSFYVMDNDLF